ncbi:type VII secretion AAA-ATPase EccA [Rhodococcus oryzae]|uniref:Type VII secretion AAA-ATPase EccA n=1 Tax=Rhodococcus oryzae TaxID=2571143 RepID=A0ABY2RS92_9NOCA|nr:type VII secretion AAA-ATPase EccA [Rhodococcus oryzae]TJZ80379.1 type VII secretion AAA-ATPase EccA [Rhodococcus oryzae]
MVLIFWGEVVFEHSRARNLFDAGLLSLGFMVNGRRGVTDSTRARSQFQQALELDPDMCDAWLGLAATGLVDSRVIVNLYRTARISLGREQTRIGLRPGTLSARFETGYLVSYPLSNGNQIWVAAAANMIESRQYTTALGILDSLPAGSNLPVADYVRAVLYLRTQRWPDLLEALAESERWTDDFLRAGANSMVGHACAHLGLLEEADRRLRLVDAGPIAAAARHAQFMRGLIARDRDDEPGARALFERVYASEPGFADNTRAMGDTGFRLNRTSAEQIACRLDPWDPASAPPEEDLQEADRRERGEAILAESRRMLDAMIGLGSVKREVEKLTAATLLARSSGEANSSAPRSRHLVFTGPPGVGKTEVARILGKMYHGLGLLKTDTVLEVAPNDFFAPGYGTPEHRSREIFERALDGVLFIDEAYSLYQDGFTGGDAFGTIVINALLATMENHRDRLVVIVAGYEDAMDAFLERNAGLKSRFAKQIRFPSYTPSELAEIAGAMARNKYAATLSEEASDEIRRIVEHMCTATESTPSGGVRTLIDREGNGRFVRNLLEGATEERDLRLVSTTSDLQSLSAADRTRIERQDVVLTIRDRHPDFAVTSP